MAGYDGRGARFNIVAVEGNDLSFTVTAVDDAAASISLSAATITASIYNGAGTVVDTLTDAVSGAGSNIITLSLTDAEVDALVALEPKSWALVVERGGDARTWLAGSFTVSDAARARGGTSGTALTATVDSDVSITVSVYAVGSFADAVIQSTAPSSPTEGDLWVDSDDLALYVYYGSVWVALSGPAGADGDAANAAHLADTSDAHDASAISLLDTGALYTATDVEAALAEAKTIADAAVTRATFPSSLSIALSDMTTQITTGATKAYWVNPYDTTLTITKVKATLATAGSGSTVVDINEGAGAGTSILSTKITIDASGTDSDAAGTPPVVSDSSIAADGRLTFDIDTAGTSAAGLMVHIMFTRAV